MIEEAKAVAQRLRDSVQKLRRTSMPIADVVPMQQDAADTIDALVAHVFRQKLKVQSILDELAQERADRKQLSAEVESLRKDVSLQTYKEAVRRVRGLVEEVASLKEGFRTLYQAGKVVEAQRDELRAEVEKHRDLMMRQIAKYQEKCEEVSRLEESVAGYQARCLELAHNYNTLLAAQGEIDE